MDKPGVWLQVLGPLHLFDDGRPVRLGGVKPRAALGYLLLRANQVVATSDLLHALWPHDAPPSARKVLQNAISGLRGLLRAGDDGIALVTHPSGYSLRVPPDRLDLSRFERLAEQGRAELAAGAWEPAARSLRAALALWQGPALADLAESGVAWPELAGLRRARAAALEDLFEAELACGRHHEVSVELEAIVEHEPDRERLCAQLMLALYRCGRQVDALALYRRVRNRLLDGYGLEPGPRLQALERAILNHDTALDLAAAAPPVPAVPSGSSRGAGRRPRFYAACGNTGAWT
ncbi:AfsR/SARP family transcriptional regulator [Dactylosporangium sp. NPDC051484]|uniref:AfsR/SARP family transcriptional regulator n=1 Tax=Dactylosporangium sp. NPDC051484 TaxID=3154942 RepID=UPI00344E8BA2